MVKKTIKCKSSWIRFRPQIGVFSIDSFQNYMAISVKLGVNIELVNSTLYYAIKTYKMRKKNRLQCSKLKFLTNCRLRQNFTILYLYFYFFIPQQLFIKTYYTFIVLLCVFNRISFLQSETNFLTTKFPSSFFFLQNTIMKAMK